MEFYSNNIYKKKDEITIIKEDKKSESKNLTFKEFKFESVAKRKPQKVVEKIIQIIEKNPNTLENLDISKLEIIDMYYKRKIAECKRKLKRVE